uniref:Uncharacterized protein n=1 Tax=Arundo donax TaxID=35708 RepID=A0A0A9BE78_ARUDO
MVLHKTRVTLSTHITNDLLAHSEV